MRRRNATAGQQNGACRRRRAGTTPDDAAAGCHIGSKRNGAALDILVRVIAKRDDNPTVIDIDLANVLALGIGRRGCHAR